MWVFGHMLTRLLPAPPVMAILSFLFIFFYVYYSILALIITAGAIIITAAISYLGGSHLDPAHIMAK